MSHSNESSLRTDNFVANEEFVKEWKLAHRIRFPSSPAGMFRSYSRLRKSIKSSIPNRYIWFLQYVIAKLFVRISFIESSKVN